VDIKIGIKESPRELVISSSQSAEEVEKAFAQTSQDAAGLFRLEDDKGRRFLIPVKQISYLEIVPAQARKVGFSVGA